MESLPITTILYKLILNDKWYVGSTRSSIQDRMKDHYRKSIKYPNRKLYKAISEFGGWSKVKCEIIAGIAFTTKEDLWKQEDTHIKLEDCLCLNTNRAILTEEERREISSKSDKRRYNENRTNPEWMEQKRQRSRESYARRKIRPQN